MSLERNDILTALNKLIAKWDIFIVNTAGEAKMDIHHSSLNSFSQEAWNNFFLYLLQTKGLFRFFPRDQCHQTNLSRSQKVYERSFWKSPRITRIKSFQFALSSQKLSSHVSRQKYLRQPLASFIICGRICFSSYGLERKIRCILEIENFEGLFALNWFYTFSVSSTSEKFENGFYTLETHLVFSVHTASETFENAKITGHFECVFEENTGREITCLSWRHRFPKVPFSKRFLSTPKCKAGVLKLLRFE